MAKVKPPLATASERPRNPRTLFDEFGHIGLDALISI